MKHKVELISAKVRDSTVMIIKLYILTQKCPFEAIHIINLPSNLERDTTHRYSANSFKLHRLVMKLTQVGYVLLTNTPVYKVTQKHFQTVYTIFEGPF